MTTQVSTIEKQNGIVDGVDDNPFNDDDHGSGGGQVKHGHGDGSMVVTHTLVKLS